MKTIDVFAKWLFESRFGKMKNTQHYKLVGSGAGVIVYQVLNATKIRLLLSVRSAVVGEGFGITGGGFVEAGQLLNTPLRTMVETASEAYREVDEENLKFASVITLEEFLHRAQPIAALHVHTGDESMVHATNFSALCVTDAEWEAISTLDGSDERSGALREVIMTFSTYLSRMQPETGVQLTCNGEPVSVAAFYHHHELRAIAMIAWHHQQGKLWGAT